LREDFEERILPFNSVAAREYAVIATTRRSTGCLIAPADCQIAAIARSVGMTLATRNVRDLKDVDITLVNPWTVG